MEEVAGLTPEHRRKIDQRKRAYVDLIRDTLNQLKKEGKLREVDVTVATFSRARRDPVALALVSPRRPFDA